MTTARSLLCFFIVLLLGSGSDAFAQHLWWDVKDHPNETCLYGQITVLATHSNIYYCGANWHPGEPAGGYCGIQQNSGEEHRTIFSIWDTSPTLHPVAAAGDPRTHINRFGGEGEGGHTHMIWPWKVRETFQFFVRKVPGKEPDTTEARYYIFDDEKKTWIHSATITSPNGGHKSVETIGGGLNSFLENFAQKDPDVPKLATYRLWLGSSIGTLKSLTRATGDGKWGELNDAYFLAQGEDSRLEGVFSSLPKDFGKPVFGEKGKKLDPISDRPMPAGVAQSLEQIAGNAK
jgi:hypothetical protein